MSTLYVTSPCEVCWHILRPNERALVWCQAHLDGPDWTHIMLQTPPCVCLVCLDAEARSVKLDVDRVPVLAGAF
jgi:hypothetical protein